MAINMSPAAFQMWVASEGLEVILAPLRWVFDLLQLQTSSVVAVTLASLRGGIFGLREQAFRALECIEFGVMYRFVELLTRHSTLASLVWLHDGVWISPAPAKTCWIKSRARFVLNTRWLLVHHCFALRSLTA